MLLLVALVLLVVLIRWPRRRKFSVNDAQAFLRITAVYRAGKLHKHRRAIPAYAGPVPQRLEAILADLRPALVGLFAPAGSPHWLSKLPSPTSSIVSQNSSVSFVLVDDNRNPVVFASSPEMPTPFSPLVAEEARRANLVAVRLCLLQLMALLRVDFQSYEDAQAVAEAADSIVQLYLSDLLAVATLRPLVLSFAADVVYFLRTATSVYTYSAVLAACGTAPPGSAEETVLAVCASQYSYFMPSDVEAIVAGSVATYTLFCLAATTPYAVNELQRLAKRVRARTPSDAFCLGAAQQRLRSERPAV